jgi:ubiquitin carboxyl-terminal hydrolase L3
MKQTIGNACGTIAMLHCVMNHTSAFQLQDGKFWSNFYRDTKGMDAEQRALALNDNEDIEEEHQYVASQGGSSSSHPINDNLHFIVFSAVDGQLYEFDGRKQRPINHGPCDNVLYGSVSMIRRYLIFKQIV